MLTENDVIEAVVKHLEDRNWLIEKISTTTQRGFDILALNDDSSIVIEAKGETSSKPGSARHGKPFNASQRSSHVARAFYKAASVVSEGKHKAGIALPSTAGHAKLIDEISPALETLQIVLFWVAEDGTIRGVR